MAFRSVAPVLEFGTPRERQSDKMKIEYQMIQEISVVLYGEEAESGSVILEGTLE